MTKEEITFLYEQGFSISEISAMNKPLENLVEGGKANDVAGATEEKPTDKEDEKKTKETDSSESSDTITKLTKQIEDLKKLVQKKNREDVEIPTPEKKSTEEIMQSYFENL